MSVTSNNPIPSGPYAITAGATVTITPPQTQGNWGWVVLSNSSPFDCAVSVGLPGQWLEAWGYDVFVLQPGNNPITVTAKDDTSGGAIGSGRIKANWYQINDKPLGSYPGTLSAAAVAASLAAVQGQVLLGDTGALSFAGSGTQTFTYAIPAGVSINAVGLFAYSLTPGTGNWRGLEVALQSSMEVINFYDARPFANWGAGGYFPNLPGIFPYASEVYGSVLLKITSTGASGTAGGIQVVGYEGVVPAYQPPALVASGATVANVTGNSNATLLAQLTDGRQYAISSVAHSSAGASAVFVPSSVQLSTITSVGGTVALSFPNPVVTAGPLYLANTTSTSTNSAASVTYTYI